jgi:hypothetical protein
MITFLCPACNQRISTNASEAGTSGTCPACGGLVQVPVPRTRPGLPVATAPVTKSTIWKIVQTFVVTALVAFGSWRVVDTLLPTEPQPLGNFGFAELQNPIRELSSVTPVSQWQRYEVCGLSAPLPSKPVPMRQTPPQHIALKPTLWEERGAEVRGVAIHVSEVEYDGVTLDSSAAIDAVIGAFKARSDVKRMKSKTSDEKIGDLQGSKVYISFRQNNEEKAHSVAVVAKGRRMWMLAVTADSERMPALADEFFRSVRLEP